MKMFFIDELRNEIAKQLINNYNEIEYVEYAYDVLSYKNREIVFSAKNFVNEEMYMFGMSLENSVEKFLECSLEDYI